MELLKSYLAGGTGLSIFVSQPTETATVNYFKKTHGLRFLWFTSVFSYLCSTKNRHTAHMLGGIKNFKRNMILTLPRL